MLESISEIKKKTAAYKYLSKGEDIDVDALVLQLKADTRFSKFSEGELYGYALGMIANGQSSVYKNGMQSILDKVNKGKPNDPIWNQYSYEEIIAMEENGVLVPEDFLEWAHSMQDADTTSYQIENESDDSNAFDNLETDTETMTKSDIQKKAQAFASKAEAQEDLTKSEIEKTQPMTAQVETKQNEIARTQQLSIDRMEDMKREWTALDKKFQNGEVLTDTEQKRYTELGTLLNNQQNDIVAQADSLTADIDELMSQIDKISDLVNTNGRIEEELKDVGTRLSKFEGGDRKTFLPNMPNTGLTGMQASFYFAAMGNNLSTETESINTRLYFDTMDVQHKLNANVALSELASSQSVEVKDVSKVADTVPQQQGSVQAQNASNEDEELPLPENRQSQPQSANASAAQQRPESEVTSAQTTSTDAAQTTPGANTAAETAPSTDTGETTPTAGAEDPLEAETKSYVEACAVKNQEMLQAEEALEPLKKQVLQIKKNQKQEDAKLEKDLKDALKEYNSLLKKVQSGNDLGKKDMMRFDFLGKLLSADNGKFIVQMQNKVDVLTGFSSELEKDISLSVSNAQYGAQAVEKGKEYAKSVLGDREGLAETFWFKAMPKEQKYDILYGKAGESAGRDAIDSGEILVANSNASNTRLSASLPLGAFATEYSGVLNEKIANTNKEVNTMNQDFDEAFAKNAEKKQSEGGSQSGELPQNVSTNNANSNQSDSSANSEKKEVTEEDGKNVEKQGKDVKKDGDEAKSQDKEYKKEKKSTDKQIKTETANLKANEKRIKTFTKDTEKANRQMEQMAIEVQSIVQSLEQQPAQQSEPQQTPAAAQPATAVMPVTPVAAAGNNVVAARTMSAAAVNSNSARSAAPRQTSTPAVSASNSIGAAVSQASSEAAVRLQTIAAQSPQLQQRVAKNASNITKLQKSSTKKAKKIDKLYRVKLSEAKYLAKQQEESVKNNEKLKGTVTKIGYVFTGTKIAGQALMLMPWSAAAGAIMFSVGKYGEVACYVTNAAIDVANGNFLGALVSVGAAAMSFASGPVKINGASEAVKGAAKEGTKAVAEEGGKQALEQGVQQATTQVAEQTTQQVTQQALTATTQEIAKAPLQQAMQGSLQAATAGAGEMMKQTAATVSKQMAAEAAKSATKQALINGGLQAAGSATQMLGQKFGQENTPEEDKKQRMFISYEEKKRRRANLNKIQNSRRVGYNNRNSYA